MYKRQIPDRIKNYNGEFNFTWDSDQLKKGNLEAMTQVSDNEALYIKTLFQQKLSIIAPRDGGKYTKKAAVKINTFDSNNDTLEIDTDSFGIDSSATFAAGKNKKAVKKKLAKQDFDFLYDEKKGGLYFNENGSDKGFGEGGIIAILKGAPDLTSDNLEFI